MLPAFGLDSERATVEVSILSRSSRSEELACLLGCHCSGCGRSFPDVRCELRARPSHRVGLSRDCSTAKKTWNMKLLSDQDEIQLSLRVYGLRV